jgi:hypothetical protein
VSDDETFLGRWARRKRDAEQTRASGPPAATASVPTASVSRRMTWSLPPDPAPDDAALAPVSLDTAGNDEVPHPKTAADRDPEPRNDEGAAEVESAADTARVDEREGRPDAEAALPPVESLTYESDYRGFFADGVSEALRRRALRQLWRSNPILANVDGLNDYDGDFTDAAMVKENLKTAFDSLRGYAKKAAPAMEEQEDTAEREEPSSGQEPGCEDAPSPSAENGTPDDPEDGETCETEKPQKA